MFSVDADPDLLIFCGTEFKCSNFTLILKPGYFNFNTIGNVFFKTFFSVKR